MVNRTGRFIVWRSVCLVMIGFISVAEATVPPIPKGIVSLPPPGTNYPDQILNDSRVMGLDVAEKWPDIEPTEGVFDWSSLDSDVAQAVAHGKKILFAIASGGVQCPDWLLANYPDIQTFTFIDTNPYSPTYGQQLTIPVFWDPIFLAKTTALIQAAGARYAANPSIVVVGTSFANCLGGDWNIPSTPQDIANWLAAGYTSELMVNAGETIIDATMAAFPNQNVVLRIGLGAPGLDPSVTYLAETVVDYATTTYGRFITAKDALAATTPDPSTVLFDWLTLFNQCPNVAAQMLWNVSGDNTYRMNGGVPGNPATILLNAITIGTRYGTQYQEIYEADLMDSTLSSVISTAKTLLTTTPPLPAAPSNVTGTATDSSHINLTWHDNANNELGYRLESKLGATGTYEVVTTFGQNTTAGSIKNLIEGTQYYFRMRAVNAGGVSAYSNETSATTVLNSPGVSLVAQALSSSKVRLTWRDNSSTETGFKIERSPVTNTNYTEIATVGANATSFTDTGLSAHTKYYYRVRAYNTYTTSAYSTERSVTTQH